MSHGEDPGDDGSVALEQRLQGYTPVIPRVHSPKPRAVFRSKMIISVTASCIMMIK